MKQYLELLQDVLDNGVEKSDRTGTGTISVFGRQMRFDLSKGFPLLTTKRVHFKGIVAELLWFISGSTNNDDLEKLGATIWREWQNEQHELPNIYSKQWVRWEGNEKIIKVKRKNIHDREQISYPIFPLENQEVDSTDDIVGKVLESTHCGKYIILSNLGKMQYGKEDRQCYLVQFLKSGFKKAFRKQEVLSGRIRDPYFPSVMGIGYMGEYDVSSDLDKNLKKVWAEMMHRCYDSRHNMYHRYGERGVFVCRRWHNYANFREDVEKLPNWHKKKYSLSEYQLDKDYYGSNCYSTETCVWITRKENMLYQESNRPFEIILPTGEREVFISQTKCAEKYGLQQQNICKVLNSKDGRTQHKGYKFQYIYDEDFLYRYRLPINQLNDVISQIKSNPESRRLLVNAWNVGEINDMALPPCHFAFQFYVADGKLSCHLMQRSGDAFLGIPYNIASYSLLTHMIAQVCGLEVGELIHTISDLHIYLNHLDQVRLQLTREPRPLPTLLLNSAVTSLFDFKESDIFLENYNPHPSIKGEVSV